LTHSANTAGRFALSLVSDTLYCGHGEVCLSSLLRSEFHTPESLNFRAHRYRINKEPNGPFADTV